MRFTTDDGRFGFLVTPLTGPGMFRFQLVVDGLLIGDAEAAILGSIMGHLADVPHFEDQRLGLLAEDPGAVLSALGSEQELHDPATVASAESLDRWQVYLYEFDGSVVVLAREYQEYKRKQRRWTMGPLLVSQVDPGEYAELVAAARGYWSWADDRSRRGEGSDGAATRPPA